VGDVERREVIGGDSAVEVGPVRASDQLLGGAEPLEDHHLLVAGGVLHGQLDVAEHPVGVGVGHEQRTGQAGGSGGELVTVHQPQTDLHGVDAEAGVGDVEE
jgi:hypothetical protein